MVDQVELRWQPIETAPRDKSMLIAVAFLGNGEPHWIGVIRWEPQWVLESGHWTTGDAKYVDHPSEGEWSAVTIEGGSFDYTHWMPLPNPPHPNNTGEV